MTLVKTIACSVALMALAANAQAGETLDSVKKKGFVQCGVSTGIAGFSLADSKGVWSGIDVDMCSAIAAAVFGGAKKYKVTPLTSHQSLSDRRSCEVVGLT